MKNKLLALWLIVVLLVFVATNTFALTVNTSDIVNGAVTTVKLADGAVTDAKIGGTISASKISTDGLNADMVDGLHEWEFARSSHAHAISEVTTLQTILDGKADASHQHPDLQKKSSNVIIVANVGGDYSELEAAINSISGASESNRYLVKVMPGTYYAENLITVAAGVDVIGSGIGNTKIICNRDNSSQSQFSFIIQDGASFTNMTVEFNVANASDIYGFSAECKYLHNLNIKANVQSSVFKAIVTGALPELILENVNVDIISSSGSTVVGVTHYYLNYYINIILRNCKFNLTATGTPSLAIGVYGVTVVARNSEIITSGENSNMSIFGYYLEISSSTILSEGSNGSYALQTAGNGMATVKIDNSTIKSDFISIKSVPDSIYIGNSKIDGTMDIGMLSYSILKCANVHNGNYDMLNSLCQ